MVASDVLCFRYGPSYKRSCNIDSCQVNYKTGSPEETGCRTGEWQNVSMSAFTACFALPHLCDKETRW